MILVNATFQAALFQNTSNMSTVVLKLTNEHCLSVSWHFDIWTKVSVPQEQRCDKKPVESGSGEGAVNGSVYKSLT